MRKQQQAIASPIENQGTVPSPIIRTTNSRTRMRKYCQQLRLNSGYQRSFPLSHNEHCHRWYAKKRHTNHQGQYSRLLTYRIGGEFEIGQNSPDMAAVARLQELRRKAYLDWPRLSGPTLDLKEEILSTGLQRVK